MFKLILCLAVLSTSAFAGSRKLAGSEGQRILNSSSEEVSAFLAERADSNCSMVGSKKVRATFSKNGKTYTNDFSLRNRAGVDTSVSIDEASQTVSIEQGLLFTTNVLNMKYAGNKIAELEMVVAVGSELETVVKCN